jgi:NAD+ kinase
MGLGYLAQACRAVKAGKRRLFGMGRKNGSDGKAVERKGGVEFAPNPAKTAATEENPVTDSKIAFRASWAPAAKDALTLLEARYGQVPLEAADVVVCLGGDGFMLHTLHETQGSGLPVYGMNCGTVGFLMNTFQVDGLVERLASAEEAAINPLSMRAVSPDGTVTEALAINEVSLLRAGPQAAKLRISVDGKERLAELVCDGALVSTPAGSTAYNYSAHGPILPIGADILALTAVAAFRPRRWRGALLPKAAVVRFDVLDPERRPVRADADTRAVDRVVSVEIRSEPGVQHRILFDPGHGLEERLIVEQFA